MRVRKSHSKSRTGCFSCKKKHIKCGEELPSCQNCIYRSVACIYGSPRPTNASSESGDQANKVELRIPSVDRRFSPSPYPHVPNFTRLDEFQLLLHFVNFTAETISRGSEEELRVWGRAVPEEATQHEFLMDGLLALSSLHFAFEHPDMRARYVEIAIHYQNSGLRRYAEATRHITKANSHAIFAYSNPPKPRADAEAALLKLRQRAHDIATYLEPGRLEIYLSSIEHLEGAIRLTKKAAFLRYVMAWPGMIDKQLLEFFKRGDPMTRLIILHYGVLLIDIEELWWGKGYGVRLVEELTASICAINPEWVPWTEWARDSAAKAVERDTPAHHGSTPGEDELRPGLHNLDTNQLE
ncbi:hypothetical protein IQ07DRAFT_506861 [Pyrenochaeta sp. DS3sAY3a]|nr:hypothetical protein IQ07DRAFT_506861 [Pyrenochaeta sp. DS3sAY3a]